MGRALEAFWEEETQLSVLAYNIGLALNQLGRSGVVISKRIRDAHIGLQAAIRSNDAERVEQSLNDLDSLILVLRPNSMDSETIAQYRLVRRLIFGLQEVWPYHFMPR